MNTRFSGVCLAFMLIGLARVHAQPADGAASLSSYQQQVIVTAQRREQSAQDVPLSMSVYSDDFIDRSNVTTLKDLALFAPNLTITSSSQQTNQRIAIRGAGSAGNNAIEPSVGVYIDGVYYPRPGSAIGDLLDVERIEVLRGPQGTLFGRNTPLGALSITTHDPEDQPEVRIGFGLGSDDSHTLRAILNGPLSERLAGRLAVGASGHDGLGRNAFDNRRIGERDSTSFRGKLRFDLAPGFVMSIAADGSRVRTGGPIIEVLVPTSTPAFDGTLNALFGATATTTDTFDRLVNQDHRDRLNDDQWGIAVDGEYTFGNDASLRFVSSVRDWAADVVESSLRIPADVLPRFSRYATETFAHDVQFTSPPGRDFEYVAGVYDYREDYAIAQSFDAGTQFCTPVIFALVLSQTGNAAVAEAQAQNCLAQAQERVIGSKFRQSLTSLALYGQITWHLSERWAMSVGARHSNDSKDGGFDQNVDNSFALLIRPPEATPGLVRRDSEETWLLSAQRYLGDDVMVYATLSTGFKSGGFNSEGAQTVLGPEARTYAPETSSNYEVGIKARLIERRLTANISLFRTDIHDFQDRTFDGLSFLVRNAGELRQQGFEADLTYTPTDSLQLSGGFAWLDSEFQRFPNGSPLPGSAVPQDLAGTRMHFSPEWQGSLVAQWDRQLRLLGDVLMTVRSEWQYTGTQNVGSSTNNNPQTLQRGFSVFNGSIGFAPMASRWELRLFAKNLLDEGYCETLFDQPFGSALGAVNTGNNTSVQRCAVGAPRTYGMGVGVSF